MATATRRMGLLPAFQEEMIHRALELGQVTASEIMTPRGKIFSLSADLPLEAASARIVEEQHSRVPVFEPAEGRDHIIGVVYSKDVSRLIHFRAIAQTGSGAASSITLRQVMRDVLVVPETKLAVELLQEFQERRRQIAIVVDEFGSTLGLVTAEDVLEQVVGELEDEFDTARSLPLPASDGGLLLDGSASLRDLATQLRWKFPREAGVETPRRIPALQTRPHSHGRRAGRLRRGAASASRAWPASASRRCGWTPSSRARVNPQSRCPRQTRTNSPRPSHELRPPALRPPAPRPQAHPHCAAGAVGGGQRGLSADSSGSGRPHRADARRRRDGHGRLRAAPFARLRCSAAHAVCPLHGWPAAWRSRPLAAAA